MAVSSFRDLFRPGEWAVMGNDGIVHLAAKSGNLPSGGARCGAVGTAFMVSSPDWRAGRVCGACSDGLGGGLSEPKHIGG